MIKKLSVHNRQRLVNNMKSRFGDVSNSIVLMKGSVPTFQHDSDACNFPKYEMNFTYLFGINQMFVDGYLELDSGKSFFIIPDDIKSNYYSHQLSKQEAIDNFGVDDVLFKKDFLSYLKGKNVSKAYLNTGKCFYMEAESHVYDDPEVLEILQGKLVKGPLYAIINNMRVIKSPIEIEMMREVCEISSQGHIEMMRHCKPGMKQFELVGIFQQTCTDYQIEDHSYNPICCSGRDCSILHYVQND